MGIDKAGRDDKSRGIDYTFRPGHVFGRIAHENDLLTSDPDVGRARVAARSVDHLSVNNEHVEILLGLSAERRDDKQATEYEE